MIALIKWVKNIFHGYQSYYRGSRFGFRKQKGRPSLPNNMFNVKIFWGAEFATHGMERMNVQLVWNTQCLLFVLT